MIKKSIIYLIIGLVLTGFTVAQAKTNLLFLRAGSEGEKAVVGPQVRVFEAENPGIKVDMVMVPWGQQFIKMMTMIGAGKAPDVSYIGSRWIPSLVEMNAIIPITVPAARKAEYFKTIWPMVSWKGKIYGIPRAFSTKVLYYNTELFKEAGIKEAPKTWEELKAAAKAIGERTDAYGYALAGEKFVSTTSQFFNSLFQNEGRVFDGEGNVIINNENGVEALEFYRSLARYAEPGPTAYRRETLCQLFKEGKVGMYVSGPWRRGMFENAGTPYAVAPLPAGPKGKSACILVSDSLVAFTQSQHQTEAVKLALFLTSYENQKTLDTKWGMTPMRAEETKLAYFEIPTWKPFITMIPRGSPQPLVKDWEYLEDVVTDAIQIVLLGEASAKRALDKAAAKLAGLK